MLHEVGKVLRSSFRESDVLGRVGGDEFMVLLPGLSAASAKSLLAAARERLETPRGQSWPLSFSFGLAEAPAGAEKTREDLIREADRSMYADKSARRGREVRHDL